MHLDNKKSMQNSGALNHLLYYISILVVNCNLSFEFSTSVVPWPSPAVNLKEVLFYYIIQDWAVRRLSALKKKINLYSNQTQVTGSKALKCNFQ